MSPSTYGPGPRPGDGPGPGGVLPPGPPWLPPPRRRRVNPIVPFAVLAAVSAATIAGIYYAADYRPRSYLKDWAARMNPPEGRFLKGDLGGDNHDRLVSFGEQCYANNPCDPPPVNAVTRWITANGGSADQSDVSQCFQHGGTITLTMGDHSSYMTCQQVLALTQEIKFTVRLQY